MEAGSVKKTQIHKTNNLVLLPEDFLGLLPLFLATRMLKAILEQKFHHIILPIFITHIF